MLNHGVYKHSRIHQQTCANNINIAELLTAIRSQQWNTKKLFKKIRMQMSLLKILNFTMKNIKSTDRQTKKL